MQNNLIDQGISLMVYGMGTVFVFLCILVFAILVMSKLVHWLAEPELADSGDTPKPTSDVDPNIRRAIEQAIGLHRNRS